MIRYRPFACLSSPRGGRRIGLLPRLLVPSWFLLLSAGCGPEVQVLVEQGRLSLEVSVNREDLVLVIGGQAETVGVTLVRGEGTGPVNLGVDGVPAGVSTEIRHPGITSTGSVSFQASSSATPAADIPVSITASDGTFFDTTSVTLSIVR